MNNLYLLSLAFVCCACSYSNMQENQRSRCMRELPPEQYEEFMGSYMMTEQEYLQQRDKLLQDEAPSSEQ